MIKKFFMVAVVLASLLFFGFIGKNNPTSPLNQELIVMKLEIDSLKNDVKKLH